MACVNEHKYTTFFILTKSDNKDDIFQHIDYIKNIKSKMITKYKYVTSCNLNVNEMEMLRQNCFLVYQTENVVYPDYEEWLEELDTNMRYVNNGLHGYRMAYDNVLYTKYLQNWLIPSTMMFKKKTNPCERVVIQSQFAKLLDAIAIQIIFE